MARISIEDMKFSKIYPSLLAKAEKKGRSKEEVLAVTQWLLGYSPDQIEQLLESDLTYGDFFRQAPKINPLMDKVKGKICGVQVETIEDPLLRQIRVLDKLIDELAKGKPLEKILPAEAVNS